MPSMSRTESSVLFCICTTYVDQYFRFAVNKEKRIRNEYEQLSRTLGCNRNVCIEVEIRTIDTPGMDSLTLLMQSEIT